MKLVNARHIKAVPGRKTDVRAWEWLADLLRHGLLKASFIKLGQVASEVLGRSGRLMLRAIADGEQDAEKLAEVAQGKLKSKKGALRRARAGRLTQAQRWVLAEFLTRLDETEAALSRVEARSGEEVKTCPDPFVKEAVELLDSRLGVGERVAQTIIAEIGVDMDRFPSAKPLASGAGRGPGNNESGGKRRSGQTTKGSKYRRTALVEAAWAATRAKGTDLQAQYQRLVKRRPKKKALVAVGHTMLVIGYHLLSRRVAYADLGSDYVDRQHIERQRRRLVERLAALGVKVTIEEAAA